MLALSSSNVADATTLEALLQLPLERLLELTVSVQRTAQADRSSQHV